MNNTLYKRFLIFINLKRHKSYKEFYNLLDNEIILIKRENNLSSLLDEEKSYETPLKQYYQLDDDEVYVFLFDHIVFKIIKRNRKNIWNKQIEYELDITKYDRQ